MARAALLSLLPKPLTYEYHRNKREIKAKRAVQDSARAELHRQFDLSAGDVHMKYERPSFIVVTASEAFRAGYANIDWGKEDDDCVQIIEGDLVRVS